jgi:UDP-N-acetylmuramyl tripeptide synthase
VASNFEGANLPGGLVTALARARDGGPAALEVDEAWLPRVAAEVRPAVVALLNLSRDQLDRHHEVRRLAQGWAGACAPGGAVGAVVANADDPLVAWAARAADRTTWVAGGARWRQDATGCPACGMRLAFAGGDGLYDGGDWWCEDCTFRRPEPDMWLARGDSGPEARSRTGLRVALPISLPGRCNEHNALVALAAVSAAGVPAELAAPALAGVEEVAGRYARVAVGGAQARLLLGKNPAGWGEALDMLAPRPAPVVVALNARGVDGRDTSWIWDVPFEDLKGRRVTASGERALDMSVRLHYAGVGHDVVGDVPAAIAGAGPGPVDVVANYSAFEQLYTGLPALGAGRPRGRSRVAPGSAATSSTATSSGARQ